MSVAFVERMGGALTAAGLPRVPSLVFAALLVDDDGRMTSAELVAALEVSAASVSGGVTYLAQLGWVRRERERGSRRDLYVVDDDAWHGTMLRADQLYAPMVAALDAGMGSLERTTQAHERLLLAREFLVFVQEEMAGLATKWEARRAAVIDR